MEGTGCISGPGHKKRNNNVTTQHVKLYQTLSQHNNDVLRLACLSVKHVLNVIFYVKQNDGQFRLSLLFLYRKESQTERPHYCTDSNV